MGRVTVGATIENLNDLGRVQLGEMAQDKVRRIDVAEALVDTGATTLSLPSRFFSQLGLLPLRTRRAVTPSGVRDARGYGAVRLTILGRECFCDVTELDDACPVLIGQVPLELLDFIVDPGNRQLIGNPAHGGEQLIELM